MSELDLKGLDPSIYALLKSMANGAFAEQDLRNEAILILKRLKLQ